MMEKEFIVYNGEKFWLLNTGKYYNSGRKTGENERLLHRRIWQDNFGKIPDDHHIHHINGNWKDNSIENLECINRIDHQRMHMHERFQSDIYRQENKMQLIQAQEKAKIWHLSEEGRLWHSKHSMKIQRNRMPKEYICVICNNTFTSKSFGRVYCCSLNCTIKNRNNKMKLKKGSGS